MHTGTTSTTREFGRGTRMGTKAALVVGFLALSVAIFLAHRAPATGYELSIYTATPTTVWVGVGAALFFASVCAFVAPPGRTRLTALALGGACVMTVTSLPVIRGYFFRGSGDALTHLGWTKEILAGTLEPLNLFYPAVHLISVTTTLASGVPVETTLLLAISVLLVAFLAFMPLTARALTDDPNVVTLVAMSGWLLLPINHVAVHMIIFPTTQALFFLPVLLFALVVYLRRPSDVNDLPAVSPYTALLALTSAGMVLFHPQQAANVIVLFGVITVVQWVVRRRRPTSVTADHRPMFGQTVFLTALFLVWSARRTRFRGALSAVVENLLVAGTGSVSEIGQRNLSLVQIGAGIEELFVKLFLASAIYTLLSGAYVALLWFGGSEKSPDLKAIMTYFVVAQVPLVVMFGLYFMSTPTLGFRQLGILFLFATLFGGFALARLSDGLGRRLTPSVARTFVAVLFAGMLVLSVVTIFASPFIYKASGHVSEQQYEGHEFAFEHRGEDMYYTHLTLSSLPYRYGDAIYGVEKSSEIDYTGPTDGTVSPEHFNGGTLAENSEGQWYFKISRADFEREVSLYNEFRHSSSGFAQLSQQPRVDKVHSNGEFHLYVVNGTASA